MDNEQTEGRLFKKKELAALLCVSPRTIDNWVQRRVIPYLSINDRLHLFDPVAVKAALAQKFDYQPLASINAPLFWDY